MAAPPIYNPVIPCVHPIPGGMYPGRMIRFQGNIPPQAQRFAINLQCGPNTDPRDDIALHLNFRFVEQCVVRNSLTSMNWGVEDTSGGMPLQRGMAFEALVLCEPQSLKIALNGIHFCEFAHRTPLQRISHITIDGDVAVQFIGFEGAAPPPQQTYMGDPNYGGAYGAPPPAYGSPGYGAPPQEMMGPPQGYNSYVQQAPRARGMGTGAALGLGAAALAGGGLAGYALGGGFGGHGGHAQEQGTQLPAQTQPISDGTQLPAQTQPIPDADIPDAGQMEDQNNYDYVSQDDYYADAGDDYGGDDDFGGDDWME